MTQILIREMQKNDIEQIMEIESVSFGKYHWSKQSFSSEIDNNLGVYCTAIDVETNKVVGYSGYWLILDEAHVTTIAVRPEFRKHYIGELLLQNMIDSGYENKAKWFTLEVRTSNISAQNLYYKYKFKSLGIRAKYYQDNNEDAIIMWTENIWDSAFKEEFNRLKLELHDKQVISLVK